MTTLTECVIDTPGVYNILAEEYHADPVVGGSLSVSGARMLLPPSCPARFHYERAYPQTPSTAFDVGHAAHLLVLGSGPDIDVVYAADWRTTAARQQRDEAHAAGRIPLLEADYIQVQAMAAALREDPIARRLFDDGQAEQSLFWVDGPTGVRCRARVDWLRDARQGQRRVVVDYKTTQSAAPESIGRHIANYGYHMQAAWYLDGVHALGLADDAAFLFVFQDKTPPYLVTVAELDHLGLRVGRALGRQAREIYRDCTEAGVWPGYSNEIVLAELPPWELAREREKYP